MIAQATILVVDDQPELLAGLALTLEAVGYRVLTAANGMQALEQLRTQAIDLIIADIAMPELNGYQLFEHVHKHPQWVNIPFVFLTARAMDSDVRYGKAMGVDDYLTKPIKPEDLLASVEGRLRRSATLRQAAGPRGDVEPAAAAQPAEVASIRQAEELQQGLLLISVSQHRVWLGEREIQLTPREFKILEHLARNAAQVVEPHDLLFASHGLNTDNSEAGSLLRPLIRSLRRKLGYPIGAMGCIENVRGVGYRLIPPDEEI